MLIEETTTAEPAIEAAAKRSLRIEYSVIIGAAVLLLTVPSLTQRFLFGPLAAHQVPPSVHEALYLFGQVGGLALLLGYVIHVRGVGWRRLGLRPERWRRSLAEGLGLGVLVIAIHILWSIGTGQGAVPPVRGHEVSLAPWAVLLALWVLVLPVNSIAEELLRAYVIRRGEDMGWATKYAAFVSVLLFFSYHTYYVQSDLFIVTLTGGVLWTAYYVVRRDLLALIIAHTVTNYAWIAIAA